MANKLLDLNNKDDCLFLKNHIKQEHNCFCLIIKKIRNSVHLYKIYTKNKKLYMSKISPYLVLKSGNTFFKFGKNSDLFCFTKIYKNNSIFKIN